ncbi:hypothetical protein WDJ51_03905 [Rathayibacter sp. YIM 133350]|uniref:hypothetical protein n=1 Tax=Rathayibacter sp. YIM 133350 TaxID=3131992 RepID=UPI00307E76FC
MSLVDAPQRLVPRLLLAAWREALTLAPLASVSIGEADVTEVRAALALALHPTD